MLWVGSLSIILGLIAVYAIWIVSDNIKVNKILSIVLFLIVIAVLLITGWFPKSWDLAVETWHLRWKYFFDK